MPDKGKRVECEGRGGATQLVIDSVFKVQKTGGDSFVGTQQTGKLGPGDGGDSSRNSCLNPFKML